MICRLCCICFVGYTGIHLAAQFGHTSIVAYLIAKGQDINARDMNGMTPLMWSCYRVFGYDRHSHLLLLTRFNNRIPFFRMLSSFTGFMLLVRRHERHPACKSKSRFCKRICCCLCYAMVPRFPSRTNQWWANLKSQSHSKIPNLWNSNPKSHDQNLNPNPKSEQQIPISKLRISIKSQSQISSSHCQPTQPIFIQSQQL